MALNARTVGISFIGAIAVAIAHFFSHMAAFAVGLQDITNVYMVDVLLFITYMALILGYMLAESKTVTDDQIYLATGVALVFTTIHHLTHLFGLNFLSFGIVSESNIFFVGTVITVIYFIALLVFFALEDRK